MLRLARLQDKPVNQRYDRRAHERGKKVRAVSDRPNANERLPELGDEGIESIAGRVGDAEDMRDKDIFGWVAGDRPRRERGGVQRKGNQKNNDGWEPGGKRLMCG